MKREQTGLSGLLLVLSSEDEGEWNGSNAGEGMASMRVTANRAKGEYYMYVVYVEVVAGQQTTRHHWPIFVFTRYFHA